ncbi:hypothetical protein CBR_g4542 [Chara braunii]|uniref:Uncharacterized protein n=1 Tax=Chara braunii TaxID=69332 RepID=A0A388KI31_CHABU|nr:hypothetical protein CBR_g4542 [Chara braunii]|eukprot:GBG69711.1 hypothetical protein CBR_g4542 [Chara braunii]
MVTTRGCIGTSPYTKQQEEEAASILVEQKARKENKELEKKAKKVALLAKKAKKEKELEEELKRLQKEKEAAATAVEEEEEEVEVPLQKPVRTEERGESSGAREREANMEKMVTEWVANPARGEEEETLLLVPQAEREAVEQELRSEADPLRRQTKVDEKMLEWKLRLARERTRQLEAAKKIEGELRAAEEQQGQLGAQVDLNRKVELLSQNADVMLRAQQEQLHYLRGHDIALQSMHIGLKDFARDMMMSVASKMRIAVEGIKKFCTGAIERAKIAAPKEEEARPHRERVKARFPKPNGGKKGEDFDNWEANIKSCLHLQDIAPENHVLVAFQALKEEASSLARSLAHAAKCDNDMVTYSSITTLREFLEALRKRFADVTRRLGASDKLQTIHAQQWRSARALKAAMDDLVAIPGHGVIETRLVPGLNLQDNQVLYIYSRALPEPIRGQLVAELKSEDGSSFACRLDHPDTVLCYVSLDDSLDDLDNELIALRSSWAKKAKSKGELMIADIQIAHTRVPGLNLQDNQVLYIYSRALSEPIRGQLVGESKSGKYNYRLFRDLALQREQMTAQVKGSYASVVKSRPVGGYDKRVLWRQKRQDHMLVLFDDETVEKLPLEESEGGGGNGSSESGKGDIIAVMANKGGQNQWKKKKKEATLVSRAPRHCILNALGKDEYDSRGMAVQNRMTLLPPVVQTTLTQYFVSNELIALRSSWAKKAKSEGELMIADIEIAHTRVGALLDPGSTRSYISEKAIRKLHLGMKVKDIPRPITSILADKSTITVSQYVDRVKCYFRTKEVMPCDGLLHGVVGLIGLIDLIGLTGLMVWMGFMGLIGLMGFQMACFPVVEEVGAGRVALSLTAAVRKRCRIFAAAALSLTAVVRKR